MNGVFPVSDDGIRAAFDFLNAGLAGLGHSEAVFRRLSVILDEACSNMIRHDPTLTCANTFCIEVSVAGPCVSMTILDPGQAFDPLAQALPVNPRIGGQGLKLIRELADRARYTRSEDENRLEVEIQDR